MIHSDAYGASGDDHDELPELPIPRPAEWGPLGGAPEPAAPTPLRQPSIGGGASYTSASDDPADAPAPAHESATIPTSQSSATDRTLWDLAARLTSGMLANPARAHASVKDAMGLFDQFLQEVHAYSKIAAEFDLHATESDRRRAHEEYFHRRSDDDASSAGAGAAPGARPSPPPPSQPRPMGDYQPLPPGVPRPYVPGTMSTPATPPNEDAQAA